MNVPVRSTFALNQFVRTDEIEWQQLHEPGVTGGNPTGSYDTVEV